MALESAPGSALGRIDPSSLVGLATPVVEPRATAALAEAFRSGMINANDIHDRVSERAKSKEKMEITLANRATAEAEDPALIEARRQQMLAAGVQGELAGAQAGAALPNVAEAEALRMQSAQNAAQIQKYPMAAVFDKLGPKYGVTEPRNSDGSINFAEKSRLGAELIGHEARIENAKSEWNSIGKVTSADGRQIIEGITPQGQKLSPAEMKVKEDATKESFFKTTPGQVMAPVVTPAASTDLRSAGEGDSAIVVEPRATTPAAATPLPTVAVPGATPLAGTKTEQGFSLGELKNTGAGEEPVKMTGEQSALLGRTTFTRDIAGQLQTAYTDLLKSSPWYSGGSVQGRFGSVTLAAERDPALSTFKGKASGILAPLVKGIYGETGVLSEKDIERYQPNIPSPNDTPEVGAAKINALNEIIHTSIINNINAMDLQKQNLDPRIGVLKKISEDELAKIQAARAGGTPAAATPGTPAATPTAAKPAPVQTTSTGRKFQKDASGNYIPVP